jgi:CsoR family transcriptional regulator, copper-sensing transcriptional repressor
MSHTQTKEELNRLSRIRGHIDGIYKMVEADRPCPEVVVQIVAVRSALNQVGKILLEDHASHCLVEAAQGSDFESALASFRKALDLII